VAKAGITSPEPSGMEAAQANQRGSRGPRGVLSRGEEDLTWPPVTIAAP
jgi:hypothetical protein